MRYGYRQLAAISLGILSTILLPLLLFLNLASRLPALLFGGLLFGTTLVLTFNLIHSRQAPGLAIAAVVTLILELTLGFVASCDSAREIRELAEWRIERLKEENAAPLPRIGGFFLPFEPQHSRPSRWAFLAAMLASIVTLYWVIESMMALPGASRSEVALRWLLVAHNPVWVAASWAYTYQVLAWQS